MYVMFRKVYIALICALSFVAPTIAEVVVTDDVKVLESALNDTDVDALIVFDCDNTLIRPLDQIVRVENSDHFISLMESLSETEEVRKELEGIEWQNAGKMPVHKDLPAIVKRLQESKRNVCVVSAMKNEKLGSIWGIDVRANELRSFGFDFSIFCKWLSGEGYIDENSKIYYRDGIVCSGGFSKGQIVKMLTARLKKKPSKIVFVDDSKKHVDDVAKAADNLGIPFVGVHWTAHKKPIDREQKFSLEVAKRQMDVLKEKRVWMSDREARDDLKRAANYGRRLAG